MNAIETPNKQATEKIEICYVPINDLNPAPYNPRRWDQDDIAGLTKSVKRYGIIDPLIVSNAPGRKNVVIGGHFRLFVAKQLNMRLVPVVYLDIPDEEKEKELNLRLNRNHGKWDFDLLAEFDEHLLANIGFSSEELDEVFADIDTPEEFDLEKELRKLDIKKVELKKGDVVQLGESRMLIGDSTIAADITKLMNDEQADMCFTDPPYILDYLKAKRHGKAVTGFGAKRDRRYLETDVLPDNFTELWMANIAKVQQEHFSIIIYENWKNLRVIWNEMEKYWKVKNMIVWHLPNRHQGFSAKYKFFSKHDIAMVGTTENIPLNLNDEGELLKEEYETALFAIAGKPHWEGYQKGKRIAPTDFIEFNASDEKNSGQGVVFGTKPVEILIPYIKVLTKRNDLIVEPFGGSGSTLIAATKLKRRCYVMEKSPVYAEVIRHRWEKLTGKKARKI
ncbi:MAG: DNA methyltransferase [Patescibacteria group bacterium]